MTNPNDNAELFEIFQNQVDLDQNQDEEEDQEDEDEENKKNEEDETTEQTDQEEKEPETGTTSEESAETAGSSSRSSQTTNDRSSSSGDQPQGKGDGPSSPEPDTSAQQSASSASPAQEDENQPDKETGSYNQDLEDEKKLEGTIILSRGASIFLLILAITTMIGAYFIGLQTGSNQQAGENKTAVSSEGAQANLNNSDNQSGNVQQTVSSTNDNQSSNNESSGSGDNSSGVVPGKTYYTIGLIAYKASQKNVIERYVKPVQRSLREDGGLHHVSSVENPVGNRQIWVVVGYFEDRETAKQKLGKIEPYLNRTDYRNDYTKDILEITSEQARKIAGS